MNRFRSGEQRSGEHLQALLTTGSSEFRSALLSQCALEAENTLEQANGSRLYSESFTHLAEVLIRAPGMALPKRRAEGLLATSRYFNRFGNPFMAIYYAQPALKFAIEAAQPKLEREVNNMLALLHTRTENLPRAFEYLDQCLQLARYLKDSLAECETWGNISSAFEQAGMHREAIRAAKHAYYLGWTNDMDPQARNYRIFANSNIMLSALSLGDIKRGMTAVELALKDLPIATINPIQRLILENNIIRLLLASGKLEEAEQRAAQAREIAAPLQSIRSDLQAAIANGLVQVTAGKRKQGLMLLHESLELSQQQHRSTSPDALWALIWVYRRQGRRSEMERYQRQLRDHYRALRSKEVLQAAEELILPHLQKKPSKRRRKLWAGKPRSIAADQRALWLPRQAVQDLIEHTIQTALQAKPEVNTSPLAQLLEHYLAAEQDGLIEQAIASAPESELAMTLRHSAEAISEQAGEKRLFAVPFIWQFSEPVANTLVNDCLSLSDCLSLLKPEFSEDLTLHAGCLSYLELSRTPLSKFYQACRGADLITAAPAPPALRSRIYLRYLVGHCTTNTSLNELQHAALTHIRTCLIAIDADLHCASLTPQASFFRTLYHGYQVYTLRRMAEIAVKVPARHPVEVHLSSQRMVNEAVVDFGKRTPRYRLFGRPAESAASLRSRIVDQLSELGRKEIRVYDAQRRPTIFINDAPPPAIDFSIPL